MASLPPKLGPFEPLQRLGAGGMAETFLAVRRGPAGFEQHVCIKRILPAYESDQDFVASFLEEARTSAALRHANIVQVVDFGVNEADGSHYLALELVDGLDLRALMQREGLFDAELTTLIASELAAALAHAHAHDEGRPAVVHRDLSPSNVLISRAGEVKLTDFGIARVIGGAHRTASGVIKGKVPYMPPEYIDGGRFDAAGDLFALGVVLYELCHGRRPFDGNSELDTMRRIASGERRPFEASAPRELVACVDRLLQKRPEDRFPDALALLDALPPIAMHQARKRLAGLVRGRPSLPAPTETALPAAHAPFAPTVALPLAQAGWSAPAEPTRTASRPRAVSKTPLLVLGVALALALVAGLLVLVRSSLPPASAAVPHLPASPERSAVPSEAASRAREDQLSGQPGASTRQLGDAPAQHAASEPARSDQVHSTLAGADDDDRPDDDRPGEVLHQGELLGATAAEERAGARSRRHHHEDVSAPSATRAQAELRVVVYPFGDVWVDDKLVGQSPLSLHLSPGTHEIGAGEGRAREKRTVHLRAGESENLTFRSTPAPQN